jgi:hypothetical protein
LQHCMSRWLSCLHVVCPHDDAELPALPQVPHTQPALSPCRVQLSSSCCQGRWTSPSTLHRCAHAA